MAHFFLLCSVSLAYFCSLSTANLDSSCVHNTDHDGEFLLCVGVPPIVAVGQNATFSIKVVDNPLWEMDSANENTSILLTITLKHTIGDPGNVTVEIEGSNDTMVIIHANDAGRTEVIFECVNGSYNDSSCPFSKEYMELVRRELSFAHSLPLNVIIAIVGWIYFVAWSISFYPQIFLNFYRRSVIGLNFDFLALNILGFLCYSAFNIGVFWIPEIKKEYFLRHPGGVNPVQLNDVIFSLHAAAATAFTIFQCFIFKRGGQRISYTGMVVLSLLILTLFISLFVAVGHKLAWLDYLYVASYVKLAITLIKYIPQAWFNCRRRSTVGWSIGNILLDFTGGSFSILQMFLLSYNYNDWKSIFGDPTKFGLGAISIVFDLFFMLQHYVLFRHPPLDSEYTKIEDSSSHEEEVEVTAEKKKKRKVNDGEAQSLSDEERPLLRSGPKKSKFKQLLILLRLA